MGNNVILTSLSEEQMKSLIEYSIKKVIGTVTPDKQPHKLGDYIEEKEAKHLLGRKTTWFWNLRNTGRIPYTKVGNKVFYKLNDIVNLLDTNQK